ncbi:MAG TPA: ACP S-malonyltransferase, partial [Acidimicrobiales bacterium]
QVAAEDREGTMAAVLGLDDEQVEIACARVGGDVWVANYNAPGQVVIAGAPDAVQEAGAIAKEIGGKKVKTMPLPVSGAFHTPFMAPARDRLRKAIDRTEIRAPQGHVVANVDGMPHPEASAWQSLLNAQLCSPVRWRQTLHTLADLGFSTFIELGPGTVLTGMAKRTIADARTLSVATPDDLDRMLETLAGPPAGAVGQIEGEHLFVTERLIVSPGAGIFTPLPGLEPGAMIAAGDLVGTVGELEVRSPFAGQLMGFLAIATERVTSSEPIAWLRTG